MPKPAAASESTVGAEPAVPPESAVSDVRNGQLVPLDHGAMLDHIPPQLRDFVMQAIMAAGAGAAAAMDRQAEQPEHREFYGRAPTDLRREYSTLPRPTRGGPDYRRRSG